MAKPKTMLPEYLDAGSEGLGVLVVKAFLANSEYYQKSPYPIDDRYCEGLVGAVTALQQKHGIDPDGNVGPDTRVKILEEFKVDLNLLPYVALTKAKVPGKKELMTWPPETPEK